MITFENVTKTFADKTTAVDSINFSVQKGEFFVLIGPSGCGKTTTLKMMNRLIPLTEGTIFIDDKRISDYDIHQLRWNIGYVLQQIALFPHMTIEENISIVPEMKKWSADQTKNRVTELLEMVGLDPATYRARKPHELSGGEQQRVGVVRALAADPDIILMDEPFSALDPISREKIQDDILSLKKRINKTIVFVTHDMQEALKLADRICLMKQGQVVQLGTPAEIINQPANEFVRDFVGSSKKFGSDFSLQELLEPIENTSHKPAKTIDIHASLEETLEQLSTAEELLITENDEPIGMISRQRVIQFLTNSLKEGRVEHV